MSYKGTRSQREQAQRSRLIDRITQTAAEITGTDKLERLLLIAQQIQHIDNETETQAEKLRDVISIFTVYNEDLTELKDIKDMVLLISMRKARQAERAKQQAERAKELAEAIAKQTA